MNTEIQLKEECVTLASCYRELKRLGDINNKLKQEHEVAITKLECLRDQLKSKIRMFEDGLSLDLVGTAERLLDISGRYKPNGAIAKLVWDAIQDIANGCPKLRREYFGIKTYDRWDAQRSDHPYGMVPRHGSIWFSVGLSRDFRRDDRDMTVEEADSCIYALRNLETICKAHETHP